MKVNSNLGHVSRRSRKAVAKSLRGTKSLFKYAEERSVVCDCAHEEKKVVFRFSQNGCYGNQPHPFEVLI